MSVDFTEDRYKEMLDKISRRYTIITYPRATQLSERKESTDGTLLLRHDIDFSVHRALRLATLENERDICSTYFINPHSRFYNILESDIHTRISKIAGLQHRFGLHFDPSFYFEINKQPTSGDICRERRFIEKTFDICVDAISIHMPSIVNFCNDNILIEGLVNVNSKFIRDSYTYFSDSFCTWKPLSLYKELSKPSAKSLHVLIHPEYWTQYKLSCDNKIERCLNGRTINCRNKCKDIYGRWVKT